MNFFHLGWMMVADLSPVEVEALKLATAEHRGQQQEIASPTWVRLATLGLVACGVSDEGETWIEMTAEGCEALLAAGGPHYEMDSCWACRASFPTRDFNGLPTCPKCGAYAGDE